MAQAAIKIRTRHISLDFLGEEWKDAYLEARYLTVPDYRVVQERLKEVGDDDDQALEAALDVIKQQFHAGKTAGENGELVDFTADDIVHILDTTAVLTVYGQIMGGPSPKAATSSNPSTSTEDQSPGSEPSSDTAASSASPLETSTTSP